MSSTPDQDRKPLTEEPLHDNNRKDQAQDFMDKGEGLNTMDDILEASCEWVKVQTSVNTYVWSQELRIHSCLEQTATKKDDP